MWRKGDLCALLVEMLIGAATMENSMDVPQILKIKLPYDPVIPVLQIYPKKKKLTQKNMFTLMFIATLFTIIKLWKQLH